MLIFAYCSIIIDRYTYISETRVENRIYRAIFAKNLPQRLTDAIKAEIANGCFSFTMGTHGEFDRLALQSCRKLRNEYPELQIEVVLTNLHAIWKGNKWDSSPYSDVSTVLYDIEEAHYKQRIALSNRKMIDACAALICYVDETVCRSGAKTAMRYAKRKDLRIVNLFDERDKPFYGMTYEEISETCNKIFNDSSKEQ